MVFFFRLVFLGDPVFFSFLIPQEAIIDNFLDDGGYLATQRAFSCLPVLFSSLSVASLTRTKLEKRKEKKRKEKKRKEKKRKEKKRKEKKRKGILAVFLTVLET